MARVFICNGSQWQPAIIFLHWVTDDLEELVITTDFTAVWQPRKQPP